MTKLAIRIPKNWTTQSRAYISGPEMAIQSGRRSPSDEARPKRFPSSFDLDRK